MKIRDEFKKATIVTGAGTISETEWQFSRWTKGDKDRAYVNYRGKKGYGYIDLVTGENHVDSNENAQEAVAMFLAEYGEKEPEQAGDWYAVEMDEDDNDWGTGSYSLKEAKEMAEHMGAKYIAVIDGSECVQVIEMEQEPKWYVESYRTFKGGSYQSDADGQGFEAKNDAEAWGMVIANEKETLGWDYTVDSVEIAGGIASIRYHDEDGAEYEEEISLYYKDADGQLIQVEAE